MSPDHNGRKDGTQQSPDLEAGVDRPPTSPISRALWNFSSQWFLVPQGTGIIAVILHQLDYQFRGLAIISVIVWIYTIALLMVGVLLYLLRIFIYPRHVARTLRTDIIETACLASISITSTSIIQMIALVLVRRWGPAWGIVAYILWWINTAMAVIAVMGIPYVFVKVQPPGVKEVTPCVLLPLIAALTSAAGGGVICRYGALSDRLQVPVIIVSYLEVGLGLALAMAFNHVFVTRLFDKSFPPLEQIYQDMILCGPFGQGSFALQILGQVVSRGSFAGYNRGTFLTAEAAKPIGFASQFIGLLAWGYGTFWWVFAIISILHTFISQPGGIRKSHFTLSAWALVFPMVTVKLPPQEVIGFRSEHEQLTEQTDRSPRCSD
ncbi:Sulfite efflux pump SSU1 [Penicillium subrubescens]|uniref:Sulfite efflux pump SSU1 n=1 Tax=Penicillium subrubescens TaxID=1316194 RepID=A0A1Q5T9M9_9EURO|nr:Sulfite efflux pump SSU1 [Penicillium subrubescens]